MRFSCLQIAVFAAICMAYMGCEVKLERENIPLWLGIQLEPEASCSATSWEANEKIHERFHAVGWVIEVPVFIPAHDSNRIRIPAYQEINRSLANFRNLSVQTCLHFSLQNPFRIQADGLAQAKYIQLIEGYLQKLAYPPEKLMFSGFWIQEKAFQQALRNQFPSWKATLPATTFYLAGRHESLLSDLIDWDENYELAVIHDAPPDEMYKPYFREINQALSKKALAHNKSLFIAQSNLLGDQKLLLYKNQLRFWDESVKLEGLVINSLYCTSSLADSSTRFGLAKDFALLDYIKKGH